jgi:hypothetical protein
MSTLAVDDAYCVLAMKATMKCLLTRKRVTAGQGACARQWTTKNSRDLLEGVDNSLQRQLRIYRPAAKRPWMQTDHTTKQLCMENVVQRPPQPSRGTVEPFWQCHHPDIFVFGQGTSTRTPSRTVK